MRATEDTATEYTEYTEYTDLSVAVRVLARLIPSADREWVVGDLLEDAHGSRRRAASAALECGTIAIGLWLERARARFVLPPVREVAAGLAVDGRGVLRGDVQGIVLRGLGFCASVATLAFGVELLVRTLMTAAGL